MQDIRIKIWVLGFAIDDALAHRGRDVFRSEFAFWSRRAGKEVFDERLRDLALVGLEVRVLSDERRIVLDLVVLVHLVQIEGAFRVGFMHHGGGIIRKEKCIGGREVISRTHGLCDKKIRR